MHGYNMIHTYCESISETKANTTCSTSELQSSFVYVWVPKTYPLSWAGVSHHQNKLSSSHSPSDLYITFVLQLHLYIRHLHFPYMPLPILLSIQMIREILGDDWRMSWLYLGGHFQKGLPNEVTSAQNVARCVDRLQEEKGRIQWAWGSSSPFLRCLSPLLPLLGGCMFHL